MVNHPKKGSSYKNYKSELKEQIAKKKMQDPTFTEGVFSKILKNGGVKIKDEDLKNILSSFLNNSSK